MKQKLIITLLLLALAACSAPEARPEPADVGGGEVVGQEGELEPFKEETPQWIPGTYDYKGIIFPGTKFISSNYEIFLIDIDFLREGGGLNLYEISCNAVAMFLEKENRLEKVNSFWIQNAIPSGTNMEFIGMLYSYVLIGNDSSRDIGLDMYLSDENEWNVNFIGFMN